MIKRLTLLLFSLLSFLNGFSQFNLEGDAIQTSCNCVQLTDAVNSQLSATYSAASFDLNNPFDYNFTVNLGSNNGGADGMVFVLSQSGTGNGIGGGGIGYDGLAAPNIGIEIDTWDNGAGVGDIDDHVAIVSNGDNDHLSANNLAGPQYLGGNVEDGVDHSFQVTWDPVTMTLNVYFDGVLQLTYVGDIINTIFGGNPNVFWGFTASTGGASNVQSFCVELVPNFTSAAASSGCAGDPINFTDASTASGIIQSWQWDFGDGNTSNQQNPQNTFNNNGSYPVTLTITDDAGCTATTTSTVVIGTPGVTATATPNPACFGEQVQLNANTGPSGNSCDYSLEMFDSFGDGWNSAYVEVFENGNSVAQLGDGPLGSGFNAGNGPQTDAFTVTDGATLDFVWNAGTFDTECSYNIYDATGGTIFNADYAGGGPGSGTTVYTTTASCPGATTLTYLWAPAGLVSNSTITDPTTVLTATQTFTVTADNGGGCGTSSEITVTITEPPVGITATPSTVCAGQQVQLNATITPGTPPPSTCDYSLEMYDSFGDGWNGAYVEVFEDGTSIAQLGDGPLGSGFNTGNGPQTDAFTVTGGSVLTFTWNAGTFDGECSYYVYDWQGTNIYSDNYTVNPVPGSGTTIFTTTATCPAGAVTPTYSWTTTPFISDANIQSPTTIITATTVYSVTADDGTGCMGSNQVTITLSTPPQMVTASTPTCNTPPDGTASVSVIAGGTSPFSYQWDANAGNQTDATATGLGGGSYQVTITDATGCFSITTTSVTQAASITITPNQSDATCNSLCDGAAWFTATGGTTPYNYLWSTGGATAFNANLCAGNYSITATDGIGCATVQNYTISEPPATTVTNFNSAPANCNQADGAATITGISAGLTSYTYVWDNGETGTSATALTPGNHTVSITLISGNCLSTFDISISNTPGPTATASSTPAICNSDCNGTATALGISNGGSNSFDYAWSSTPTTTSTITGLCAGSQVVTITDSNGCSAITTTNVTEPSIVTVSAVANQSSVCSGQCTDITAQAVGGNGAPYTYIWDNGSNTQVINACPTAATFYSVTATDQNGCVSIPSIPVMVNVYPGLDMQMAANTTVCEGTTVDLWAFAWNGNGGPYTYTWSTGAIGATTTASPTSYPNSSVYSVTVTDGCSTPVTSTVEIAFFTTPEPRFATDSAGGCQPFSTTIYAIQNTVQNVNTCVWALEDGSTYTNNCSPIFHQFSEIGSHDISLTVISNDGCAGSYSWPAMINVYELPTAYFTSSPNPTNVLNTQVRFTDKSEGDVNTWEWTFYYKDSVNVLENSNIYNPIIKYPAETGSYPVNLEVETIHGCTDDTTYYVDIEGTLQVYLPNAFSPNGDGLNETFGPEGIGIDTANYIFQIFDRWGQLVFKTTDINETWNGYNKAKGGSEKVPTGVYIWAIDIKGDETTSYQEQTETRLTGHVTVIR